KSFPGLPSRPLVQGTQILDHLEAAHLPALTPSFVPQFMGLAGQSGQLRPARLSHRGEIQAPSRKVCHQIRDLDRGRQIAMNEERFRNDADRALLARDGPLKVVGHLIEEEMAARALQLVEDDEAELRGIAVLQKVEEPLEEV